MKVLHESTGEVIDYFLLMNNFTIHGTLNQVHLKYTEMNPIQKEINPSLMLGHKTQAERIYDRSTENGTNQQNFKASYLIDPLALIANPEFYCKYSEILFVSISGGTETAAKLISNQTGVKTQSERMNS